MKVNGRTDPDSRRVDELAQHDAVRIHSSKRDGELLAKKLRRENSSHEVGVDKVDLGIARAIHSELNPEAISAERRERIESLKAQIQAGTYNPPVEQVAHAFGKEIAFEILSAGEAVPEEESNF